MRTLKKRIVSMLLVLVTLLTILPTSAFAATSTGTGITPTTDPNRWTTRLTSTGQPYSYRPPMAAGMQLYCMEVPISLCSASSGMSSALACSIALKSVLSLDLTEVFFRFLFLPLCIRR